MHLTKRKSSGRLFFTVKILHEAMHLTSPLSGPNKSQLKFNNTLPDYQRVLDLNCKKKGLNNLIFSPLLSNVTNLVVSNGSEHLQNVIQFH